jgi:hypothetical protein
MATGQKYRNMTIPTSAAPATGGNAMTLIASQFYLGSQNAIVFANIPQTYKHLQLRITARDNYANIGIQYLNVYFNSTGSGTSLYSSHALSGNGTSASSTNNVAVASMTTAGAEAMNNDTANIYGASIIDILDYTNASKAPTLRSLNGGMAATPSIVFGSGSLPTVGAVTTIIVTTRFNVNFANASRASLYGIAG